MRGLMADAPLLITNIMRFAEANFGDVEVVSVCHDEPRFKYTYGDAFARSRQLANALKTLGVEPGDRVATLAWNDHRHFELYYATSCSGAVCHTVNPRLFAGQIQYILNHAADTFIFIDPMFTGLLEAMSGELDSIRGVVILASAATMPECSLPNVYCYEELLAAESSDYDWPELSEDHAASLCYTSGTTGDPKGVLYSHRSTVLHSYGVALPDVMGLSVRDCVMPLVPMFHVNAWGVPYVAPMTGAKLVLPGASMADGEALHALIESEGVTYSLGVPTVWLALLEWLESNGKSLTALQRICVGGAACPQSVIERMQSRHNVYVHHGWGMTEMSPLGVYNTAYPEADDLPEDQRMSLQLRQGKGIFGVEMKIVDDSGTELPWDGESFGALLVRGPWVCERYYGDRESVLDADGWFGTGDVATIDSRGYMSITDRTKDVIKSGGEWISSIALENIAVDHPAVKEAAVIGRPHPKWDERPLLIVVSSAPVSAEELLQCYDGKVARWWIPDAVEFVDELPHTATGKLQKLALREQFADFSFAGSANDQGPEKS